MIDCGCTSGCNNSNNWKHPHSALVVTQVAYVILFYFTCVHVFIFFMVNYNWCRIFLTIYSDLILNVLNVYGILGISEITAIFLGMQFQMSVIHFVHVHITKGTQRVSRGFHRHAMSCSIFLNTTMSWPELSILSPQNNTLWAHFKNTAHQNLTQFVFYHAQMSHEK